MSTVLYESTSKQAVGDTIQLSDSLSNYSQVTFVTSLYEDNPDIGGVIHHIYVQIDSPNTAFTIDSDIDDITAEYGFSISGNTLTVTSKTSENWNTSMIGISQIIGY